VSEQGARTPGCLAIGIPLVSLGTVVVLVVVLGGEVSEGRDVIEGWLEGVEGSGVSSAVAGDEAAALTARLTPPLSFSIDNFQAQAGTACYWLSVAAGTGSVDLRVVIVDQPDGRVVGAVSAERSCTCPEPADEPCALDA
jgi:hypothetical protein